MIETGEFCAEGIDPQAVHESVIGSLVGVAFRVESNEPWDVKYLGGAFERIFGYSPGEFVGAENPTLLSLVHQDDRTAFRRGLESVVAPGNPIPMIHRAQHRDGSVRWIQIHACPVPGDKGGTSSIDGYLVDISESREAETGARRALFLLSQSPDEAYWCDNNGKFIYANPAAVRNLGYSKEELLSMHVFDIAPNRSREEWPTFMERLRGRKHAQYESLHLSKSGKVYPVALTTTLVDFEGQEMAFASAHDISARKEQEVALRDSEDQTRQAFEEIKKLRDQLEAENIYLREEMDVETGHKYIVGQSDAIRATLRQVELVAPTESTVLLLGESGTGKGLVAHDIHNRSSRAGRPMIRVNCASIPKELYESEFFGHVKGAFTGAIRDRVGRFGLANGGTIFLDEVGEIPIQLQSKLLRVLQEGQYERVGDATTRSVDVRVIAATNRNLKLEVERGHFREDLYYRLNVFPVELAPLRNRMNDIPLLVAHMLPSIAKRMNRPIPQWTRANTIALQEYEWPGNVRELQNIIERAVITSRGRYLHFDLPKTEVDLTTDVEIGAATVEGTAAGFLTEKQMRKKERENTLTVLHRTDWRIFGVDGAAELLGIKPTTLVSRIKTMQLKRPR